MDVAKEIKRLGEAFHGRLEPNVLAGAIEYVDFGECGFAIETLCDQVFEYGVALSRNEFERLSLLADESGADAERVKLLERFVSKLDWCTFRPIGPI
jgi:hypothetical protein